MTDTDDAPGGGDRDGGADGARDGEADGDGGAGRDDDAHDGDARDDTVDARTALDDDGPRHVRTDRVGDVARVVMARPDRYNAMDVRMAEQLRAAVRDAVADEDVRCVVLTGEGPAFNTGADLRGMAGDGTDGRRLRAIASRLHGAVVRLAGAPKPVVTGVNGVAAGGGFGLALSGDVVLVHPEARFEYAYTRLGVSGDGGSTWFLPRLVGHRRAREIALLDEPIGPATAVEMGLATEVTPAGGDDAEAEAEAGTDAGATGGAGDAGAGERGPDGDAAGGDDPGAGTTAADGDPGPVEDADAAFETRLAELAAELAGGPTRAVGATKRLLDRSYARDLPAQLAAEADSIERLAGTDDYARGLAAFGGDADPEFEGQ